MGHFYCKRNLNGFIQLGGEVISYWLMIILIFPFYIYDHVFNFHIPYCIFTYAKYYCPLFVVLIFSWQIVDSLLFSDSISSCPKGMEPPFNLFSTNFSNSFNFLSLFAV